jgi:SAM-dependent methyltransferase
MKKNEYHVMCEAEQTHWWFAGKRILVQDVLETATWKKSSPIAILDIGCGTGMILDLLTYYGCPYGMDFSTEALRFSKAKGQNRLTCSDANIAIPFKDDVFSAITCLDVLEHLDNDRRAVEEMYRICAPGGLVIITVPAFDEQWSAHDVALHHKRRYTKPRLQRITAGLRWDVLELHYYNSALFIPILAIRKFRALVRSGDVPNSDFYLPLPRFLNTLLAEFYKMEIRCLRHLDLPFGVSLLMVLRKADG